MTYTVWTTCPNKGDLFRNSLVTNLVKRINGGSWKQNDKAGDTREQLNLQPLSHINALVLFL
jgi:hypothetical protein